jgi:hypothetical protein
MKPEQKLKDFTAELHSDVAKGGEIAQLKKDVAVFSKGFNMPGL